MRAARPSVTRLSQPGNDRRALGVLRRNGNCERKVTVIRALTTLAVVAAFAIPAEPASAGLLSSPLGTAAQPSHVLIWNPGDDNDS